MDALTRELAPPYRAGLANAATSASVADRLARSRVAGQLEALEAAQRAAQPAADVMTGATSDANLTPQARRRIAAKAKAKAAAVPVAVTQQGGSVSSTDPNPAAKAGPKANITRRPSRSQSRPRP